MIDLSSVKFNVASVPTFPSIVTVHFESSGTAEIVTEEVSTVVSISDFTLRVSPFTETERSLQLIFAAGLSARLTFTL